MSDNLNLLTDYERAILVEALETYPRLDSNAWGYGPMEEHGDVGSLHPMQFSHEVIMKYG